MTETSGLAAVLCVPPGPQGTACATTGWGRSAACAACPGRCNAAGERRTPAMTAMHLSDHAAKEPQHRARSPACHRKPDQGCSAPEPGLRLIALATLRGPAGCALSVSHRTRRGSAQVNGGLPPRLVIIRHPCGHGAVLRNRQVSDRTRCAQGARALTSCDAWRRRHQKGAEKVPSGMPGGKFFPARGKGLPAGGGSGACLSESCRSCRLIGLVRGGRWPPSPRTGGMRTVAGAGSGNRCQRGRSCLSPRPGRRQGRKARKTSTGMTNV